LKRVRTSELIPGMITVEDVYSFNNQLVLSKGSILTDELIARLEYYSVLSIHVDDSAPPREIKSPVWNQVSDISTSKESKPQFDFSESDGGFAATSDSLSYSQRIKSTKQFKEFKEAFQKNSIVLDERLHKIIESSSIDTDEMLSSVTSLLSEDMTTIRMFDMLQNLRDYNDQTYMHSLNVALMCNIIGRWLRYDEEYIRLLTLAGVLHDIGKIAVPGELIKKPGKLTKIEYSRVKAHTVEGYKILKDLPIDERIKEAALLHHERMDGSGYPLGRGGNDIPDVAKIVAIADVYDAMTAARVYRGPMCPFKVIAIFEQEGFQKYDSRFVLPFLENVGQTYMNNRVRLSNGREGDIVLMRNVALSRPLIKCVDGSFVDLMENKKLTIEEFV